MNLDRANLHAPPSSICIFVFFFLNHKFTVDVDGLGNGFVNLSSDVLCLFNLKTQNVFLIILSI